VATVPVGSVPKGVTITPNGAFAYVANTQSNTVSVINTASNTVLATLAVGIDPEELAITPALDPDSQFSRLNGGNTFTGNQTVNGNVSATTFAGNGAGLIGVNAATANTANFATSAGTAGTATNALSLGSVPAGNYARLDIGNIFSASQTINNNLGVNGTLGVNGMVNTLGVTVGVAGVSINPGNLFTFGTLNTFGPLQIGSSGTPILKHLSQSTTVTVPPVAPNNCAPPITVTLTGASDGDTIALGVPNALTSGGNLTYFGWVSAADTIKIKVCNPHGTTNSSLTGMIRVDIWKH
jgi:YVTN family beta-propeller protein